MTPLELADKLHRVIVLDNARDNLSDYVYVHEARDVLRSQAAEIERLRVKCLRLMSLPDDVHACEVARLKDAVQRAEYWEQVRREERDALTAECARLEDRLTAIKAAWIRIDSNRGWLSCVEAHDCRCEQSRGISDECTCGADEFRKLMEE